MCSLSNTKLAIGRSEIPFHMADIVFNKGPIIMFHKYNAAVCLEDVKLTTSNYCLGLAFTNLVYFSTF